MLTHEEWNEEIVEHQFPKFKKRMRDQGIATSCKADLAVQKKEGKVGRVRVQAWEIGDTTDIFVLTFFHVSGKKNIHMTRFRGPAGGSLRPRRLMPPLSDTLSRSAVARALGLFAGTVMARFAAKAERLRKKRHPPK